MSRTIEISDETWSKIKDQLGEDEVVEIDSFEDLLGQKLLIRTVTYHWIGKLEKMVGKLLKLSSASWVADTGRFMDSVKNGFTSEAEIEPVGDVLVNKDVVVDIIIWKHPLPTKQQ